MDLEELLTDFQLGKSPADMLGISEKGLAEMCDYSYQLMDHGEIDKAADAFFFLYHMAPQNIAIAHGLGNAEQLLGNLDLAMACYESSLIVDAEEPRTYLFLAQCYVLRREFDIAEFFLNETKEIIKERIEFEYLLETIEGISQHISEQL